mgnify:CR=1 FL=1
MVYNDIEESDYKFEYNKLIFYFSSIYLLEKFERNYIKFLKDETDKLKVKFKCKIESDEMIMLLLYKKIEKRGFRVYYKDLRLKEKYTIDTKINGNSFNE